MKYKIFIVHWTAIICLLISIINSSVLCSSESIIQPVTTEADSLAAVNSNEINNNYNINNNNNDIIDEQDDVQISANDEEGATNSEPENLNIHTTQTRIDEQFEFDNISVLNVSAAGVVDEDEKIGFKKSTTKKIVPPQHDVDYRDNIDVPQIINFSVMDTISTNSGLNGIPDIPTTAGSLVTLGTEKTANLNIEQHTVDDEIDEILFNTTQLPVTIDAIVMNDDQSTINNLVSNEFVDDNLLSDSLSRPDEGDEDKVQAVNKEQLIINDSLKLTIDDEQVLNDALPDTKVNDTIEENQIPVFSEWAQKRMEEAEKKLEQDTVNASTMKKNSTSGHKTPSVLKLRAKNYASPDCGAKIIAANSEASSTGSILTTTKDEYLLSPCTSRIWFVVELCEAIQAEVIDLANFELFSSSPKNFSVAVSNRFPTREWQNVGKFEAKDERYIQSFDLYPHLFGKYVRVDIHSHYNSEHFCPISLFRIYGTSEFEAFETENRLSTADEDDDLDDDDDGIAGGLNIQENMAGTDENTLFKSASDAIKSIVKKAVTFVKPTDNKTDSSLSNQRLNLTDSNRLNCISSNHLVICKNCSAHLSSEVSTVLSCKSSLLDSLISIDIVRKNIFKSQICANVVGVDTNFLNSNNNCERDNNISMKYLTDLHRDYIAHLFPMSYVAAMCNLLVDRKVFINESFGGQNRNAPAVTNITIDKKGADKTLLPNSILINDEEPNTNKPSDKVVIEEIDYTNDGATTAAPIYEKETILLPEESLYNEIPNGNKEVPQLVEQDADQSIHIQTPEEDLTTMEQLIVAEKELNDFQDPIIQAINEISADFKQQQQLADQNNNWENIDAILATPMPTTESYASTESTINSNDELINGGSSLLATVTTSATNSQQKVHSESVFLRLSNRVKALERNMSLSGQYLEELSRRYKKQVEELQSSFAKTLVIIEEQNRRSADREQELFEQNQKLREDLEILTERIFSWANILLYLGAFACVQIGVVWLILRMWTRRIYQNISVSNNGPAISVAVNEKSKRKSKILRVRRKSTDGSTASPPNSLSPLNRKNRRPSEEALNINGSYKELLILDEDSDIVDINPETEEYDSFNSDAKQRKQGKQKNRRLINVKRALSMEPVGSRKHPIVMRSDSTTSGDFEKLKQLYLMAGGQNPVLDEDYEIYVPGSDLVYNEFMPDGPSGGLSSQQPQLNGNGDTSNSSLNSSLGSKKQGKSRRLSSPAFLKSPFSRSNSSSSSTTGWEWYRLKKGSTSSQRKQNKSKSESPELKTAAVNGLRNDNSKQSNDSVQTTASTASTAEVSSNLSTSSDTKKQGGSFRRILKKVF